MRFSLLGNHPDGLDIALALQDSGRHEVAVYSGPAAGLEYLSRWEVRPRTVGDLEEILADPGIEAVIVASSPALRAGQLRRALQSERHVLCVHPSDDTPDLAYEAGMLQGDTGCVLLPLLPQWTHPALRRLAELSRMEFAGPTEAITAQARAVSTSLRPVVEPRRSGARVLEMELWSTEEVTLASETRTCLPGWDVWRFLGGEIAEIIALGPGEEITASTPLVLAGHFVQGGLLQATFLPMQADNRLRLGAVSARGRVELLFPQGWPGPAELSFRDETDKECRETWDAINPWAALVASFEAALQRRSASRDSSLTSPHPALTWQDEIRAVELDDAVRRSMHRRRVSTLEYVEATEEAGFKGTMTLIGCSIMWISLVLLILSIWIPWMGWLILPIFGIFLVLQVLRVLVGPRES